MDTQEVDLIVINAFQIGSTRIVSTLSPSIFNPDTWWTRFVPKTNSGQKIVNAIWGGADKETRANADFDRRHNALRGFENLKSQVPLFWQNGTSGLLNREDFWETIAPNVHIYLDDILEVDKKLIRLKKGDEIATDLGLPHLHKDEPSEESKLWTQLEQQADLEILKQFPVLAKPPKYFYKPSTTTPYRLYNGISPLKDDSIAFIGYSLVTNYFQGVECQAMWATAFLDKRIDVPPLGDKQREVAKMIVYNKRRYLSNGKRGNFLAFESNFYLDNLLREAGLSSHLKGSFKNYFVPRTARDLAGLKDEYLGGGSVKH